MSHKKLWVFYLCQKKMKVITTLADFKIIIRLTCKNSVVEFLRNSNLKPLRDRIFGSLLLFIKCICHLLKWIFKKKLKITLLR